MIITLTTDFGYKDPYAAMMKGVILGINPDAQILDITHGISPHNIMEAALKIAETYHYFPQRSCHLVVVDPGVGSARRPLAFECENHFFVGPDNGVFTKLLTTTEESPAVRNITAEHYFLPDRSETFHGRDIFAPVAAWISRGTRLDSFGEEIKDFVMLDLPRDPTFENNVIKGEVVYIDGFGNAATNITATDIDSLKEKHPNGTVSVQLKGGKTDLLGHFAEARDRRPHALINSSAMLEIFVNMGSAAQALKLKPGDDVSVTIA